VLCGGYNWTKIPNVVFSPNDIEISSTPYFDPEYI